MKIKEECGVTENSLDNAKMLIKAFGKPIRITLTYVDDPWEYLVKAEWTNNIFTFSGFSWGYYGEGPRGLFEFLQMCGSKTTMSEVAKIANNVKDYQVFASVDWNPKPPKEV